MQNTKHSMPDNKTVTRGEFLAALGSIAALAIFSQFDCARKLIGARPVASRGNSSTVNAYGNSTYGGKAA